MANTILNPADESEKAKKIKTAVDDLVKSHDELNSLEVDFGKTLSKNLKIMEKAAEMLKSHNHTKEIQNNISKRSNDIDRQYESLQGRIEKRAIKIAEDELRRENLRKKGASRRTESENAEFSDLAKKIRRYKNMHYEEIARFDSLSKKYRDIKNKQTLIKSLDSLVGAGTFSEHLKTADIILGLMTGKTGMIAENIGLWSRGIGTLLTIFKITNEFDEAWAKFRKDIGQFRDGNRKIGEDIRNTVMELRGVGVTYSIAFDAAKGIASAFGTLKSSSKGLVDNVSLFKAQLGISEDTSASILKTLASVEGTTGKAQINMMGFAAAMSQSSGVPLATLMGDIAKSSSMTYLMIGRTGIGLVKAAVEARRMGTTLESMAKTSRGLLDFQKSIDAEMEASVLIGKSINLQKAREMTYHRNIIGANKEILRISKDVNFEQLDVLQQEAFATAVGKSVDEIQKMLQSEKEMNFIRTQGTDEQRKELALYEAQLNATKDIGNKLGENWLKQRRLEQNQARWNALVDQMKELMVKVSDAFIPIIAGALQVVPPIVAAGYAVTKLVFGVNNIVWAFRAVGIAVINVTRLIGRLFGIIKPFISLGARFGIRGVPVIGWIITGVDLAYRMTLKLKESWKTMVDLFKRGDVVGGIWEGLKAVGRGIYDSLIQPFVDVYNWIKSNWMGESPSKIGLGIVDGIKAIGPMLYDFLVSPFKRAYDYIINMFSSKNITKDISVTANVQRIPTTISPSSVGDILPSISNVSDVVKSGIPIAKVDNNGVIELLTDVKTLLSGMRQDLLDGKIKSPAIYLDSQLISLLSTRTSEQINGWGVNRNSR